MNFELDKNLTLVHARILYDSYMLCEKDGSEILLSKDAAHLLIKNILFTEVVYEEREAWKVIDALETLGFENPTDELDKHYKRIQCTLNRKQEEEEL